jgi:type VI secretion system protein VasJ
MLGSLEYKNFWQWSACGKHPMIADYFYIGKNDPLMKAFSDWAEKGYQNKLLKDTARNNLFSWRFWAKGPQKDLFVCGLLRDSSDRLGRPYPFLVLGAGPLKTWEKNWDLLPLACEKTWNQIEKMFTSMVKDIKAFESEILKITPPYAQWPELDQERRRLWESVSDATNTEQLKNLRELEDIISYESEKPEIMASLDQGCFCEQYTLINLWHFYLKQHISAIPNAVFIGGTPEKAFLAVFKRPLLPDDFLRLWSIPIQEPN